MDLTTGNKLEAVRMIMRKYPKWRDKDVSVRIDSDSEVVSREYTPQTSIPKHYSLGYATFRHVGNDGHYKYDSGANWFVPSQNFKHEGLIGYSFNRFEYEIFRARILAE